MDGLMKTCIRRILILSVLTLLVTAGKVAAQDAGMSDAEATIDREVTDGDKVTFSPGESEVHYIPKASGITSTRDSVAVVLPAAPAAKLPAKGNEKDEKAEDDSILTFNFLYYIIQKYKLQDIID